ncbi:WAT1-related protein At1g44800-like isoform X1 [Quercus lobata]|uniref:WAT1-related protein At1g44800-like isoform X1 n=1 Tax=Quercus lobata TaxID=97700 RepID=UPI001247459F|nr:WAT1-related protein At1g44800-like isoform X1 [Quercus lobata]XP_030933862.1 WAT1-related protein At1g44800-like isoform X1 [Quercus lobata]
MSMTVGLYYYGLRDTNTTYAMSFFNLIPMVTFVFSTIVGIEKLGLTTKAGKMKILGAIFSVAGALIACLYKGKAFHIGHQGLHHNVALKTSIAHWVRGTFMLVGFCLSYSVWYIVQTEGYMERRVESATTYNSLLRSTSHGWNILPSYMGNCNSGPHLCPNVLSTVTNFCVHIRSSHTWCRNQTRNVAWLSFDHCWVVFLLVG